MPLTLVPNIATKSVLMTGNVPISATITKDGRFHALEVYTARNTICVKQNFDITMISARQARDLAHVLLGAADFVEGAV